MSQVVHASPAERHRQELQALLDAVAGYNPEVQRDLLTRAFEFASEAHEGQQRRSGEDFIQHPLGVARVLAELHADDATLVAALLHDVVEDTGITIDGLRAEFGAEVAQLVEGVTKLTRIHFQSREHAQAENYRKMVLAMAQDERVILIKLADRLHNMRTIEYLGRQKQMQKARETLEVYAPLAHRLGIHTMKWQLEDLAFATLHPRKYAEIQSMVNQRRGDREKFVGEASGLLDGELQKVDITADISGRAKHFYSIYEKMAKRGKEFNERRGDREKFVGEASGLLAGELQKVDITADISGRAKHFYSIYEKMAKRGKEFNEIYDLTAMRVIVENDGKDGERDCYGTLGIIHSLWKPMPGRFKDYVAMPKFNLYRSLHTTVIGPEGRPLEIQVRTREMHRTAEFGIAAHWLYKDRPGKKQEAERLAWLQQLADWQQEEEDPQELRRSFPELASDEVYVYTPKGELKSLPTGATPIDFAYSVHTDVGHRTVGAKVNGRIVPLHYRLRTGDFVEILTTRSASRGPSRDWLSLAVSSRARNKIRQWLSRETREETEARGRETLESALKQHKLPYRKLAGSPLLAEVIREMGFKKAEDFYLALGANKLQSGQVANKVLQRLKTSEVVEEAPVIDKPKARRAVSSSNVGIVVDGLEGVLVRLAKCCTPVPGDEISGYISLGKGITIHRVDCQNVKALMKNPERFTPVEWDGGASQSFRVQIALTSWDRPRLLEDVARTFAEHGANIVEYGGHVEDQMAKNWYVAEVGDVASLRTLLNALRGVEDVFDAYRVTPQ